VELTGFVRDELVGADLRSQLMQRVVDLHRPTLAELGFGPSRPDEDWRAGERRAIALEQLALVGEDPATRGELALRARAYLGLGADERIHPEAIAPNLVALALEVAVREHGAAVFDALVGRLASERNPLERSRYLGAIAAAVDPALASRALALTWTRAWA